MASARGRPARSAAYGDPAQAVAQLDTSRGRGQSEVNALRDTTVRHPHRLVASAHLDVRGNGLAREKLLPACASRGGPSRTVEVGVLSSTSSATSKLPSGTGWPRAGCRAGSCGPIRQFRIGRSSGMRRCRCGLGDGESEGVGVVESEAAGTGTARRCGRRSWQLRSFGEGDGCDAQTRYQYQAHCAT